MYVGNLAYKMSWQDLKDHMSAAGKQGKIYLFMALILHETNQNIFVITFLIYFILTLCLNVLLM